jgi:ABC-type transporter Mla subunit MlaD
MKHRRHFDPDGAALREAVQIGKMISDLDRLVRILDCDIATEEAGVFDRSNGAYPELARTLAARRDNLRNTIAALEQRLPNLARRFELTSDLLRID